MKGFSMLDGNRQIVLTGVEGAGRNSFASHYFPKMKQQEKSIRLSRRADEVIVVAMLDSRKLQNLAEEAILESLAKARKNWKRVPARVLLVLGRIDCVCDRRQNRKWIEEVMRGYTGYLKKLKVRRAAIVAHSNLAVEKVGELLQGTIDGDDVDDIRYLLSRCGHHLPRTIVKDNLGKYLLTHRTAAQMLSGELFVRRFLEPTKKKRRR